MKQQVLGEDLRISNASLNHNKDNFNEDDEEKELLIPVKEDVPDPETKSQKSNRSRKSSKSAKSGRSRKNMFKGGKGQPRQTDTVSDAKEQEFEAKITDLLKSNDWEELEVQAVEQLDATKAKSPKGFFYLGVSLYKMGFYEQACRAFQKSSELNAQDAQLQYNLALALFKDEKYNLAVEHFKVCAQLDPQHPFAYNNLAFIYNMHQYKDEAIIVCQTAKQNLPKGVNHGCHRHWAFALYKKGDLAKAIKKIKKGVQLNPHDADNWIVWGLILRTAGNYTSALHKFQ